MKIFVKVKPNARKKEVKKVSDDRYEVKTTAIPENGKANDDVTTLLAKFFRVGKTKIKIVNGICGREKIVEIITDEK